MKMADVGLEFINGQIYIVEYNKRDNVKQKKNVTKKYMEILIAEFNEVTITTNNTMYNTTVKEWSKEEQEQYHERKKEKAKQSVKNFNAFINSDVFQNNSEIKYIINNRF